MSADVIANPPVSATQSRLPREHPTYSEMVRKAVEELHEKSGSSKVAILRYITQNYKVGDNISRVNANVRSALRRLVENGQLKQVSGSGANGSFKLGEKKGGKQRREKKPAMEKMDRVVGKAPEPKKVNSEKKGTNAVKKVSAPAARMKTSATVSKDPKLKGSKVSKRSAAVQAK